MAINDINGMNTFERGLVVRMLKVRMNHYMVLPDAGHLVSACDLAARQLEKGVMPERLEPLEYTLVHACYRDLRAGKIDGMVPALPKKPHLRLVVRDGELIEDP